MATHAPRLARLFTPTFARAINAQIVCPAASQVVKPNELESALAKPLHKAHYQPQSTAKELAASLAYGIIKGRFTRKDAVLL
jgi:prophage maintenance system killer protein